MENEKEPQLVYNGAICKKCNSKIVSRTRHDFVSCECGALYVDGGLEYCKYSCNDVTQVTLLHIYETDDFETVRQYAYRGTPKRIDGQMTVTYKTLSEMSNAHLANVLLHPGPEWHLKLIAKELEYRNIHKILIEDEQKQS